MANYYNIGDLIIYETKGWSGKILRHNQKFIYIMDARRSLNTLNIDNRGIVNMKGMYRIEDREEIVRDIIKGIAKIIPVNVGGSKN